jgi:diguanylate cyclase (GGDEF)-like protein
VETRVSQATLERYARLMRQVLDSIEEAVVVLDREGEIVLFNLAFERLTGIRRGEPWRHRETAVVHRSVVALQVEQPADHRLVILREDPEQHRIHELERRAMQDSLTQLPNRDLLLDRLERALSRLARESGSVGVIFVDLDGFKAINDRHGHAGGDQLLAEVARRLQREMRQADTVGRLGGDEFLVICEMIETEQELAGVCERILGAFRAPLRVGDEPVVLGASLGAVLVLDHRSAPAEVISQADALMYTAKRRGSTYELAAAGPSSRRQPHGAAG